MRLLELFSAPQNFPMTSNKCKQKVKICTSRGNSTVEKPQPINFLYLFQLFTSKGPRGTVRYLEAILLTHSKLLFNHPHFRNLRFEICKNVLTYNVVAQLIPIKVLRKVLPDFK